MKIAFWPNGAKKDSTNPAAAKAITTGKVRIGEAAVRKVGIKKNVFRFLKGTYSPFKHRTFQLRYTHNSASAGVDS